MLSIHMTVTYNKLDNKYIRNFFFEIIEYLELHVRKTAEYEFYPNGITITAILSESHITVSTWPEKNIFQLDLFCCSKNCMKIFEKLLYKFKLLGLTYEYTILDR